MIESSPEFLIQREGDQYPPHHEGDHLEGHAVKILSSLKRSVNFKHVSINKIL